MARVLGAVSIVLLVLPCSSYSAQDSGRYDHARTLLGERAVEVTHSTEIGESFDLLNRRAHINEETGRILAQTWIESDRRDEWDEFWSGEFGLPGVDYADISLANQRPSRQPPGSNL